MGVRYTVSALDSVSPFHGVWSGLGKLRERLELTGYDVTAEGMHLIEAIAVLDKAWQEHRRMTDVKFYDDVYLLVRRFGSSYGSHDSALADLVAQALMRIVEAKKALIQRVEGEVHGKPDQ